jgi:hypothetical protein
MAAEFCSLARVVAAVATGYKKAIFVAETGIHTACDIFSAVGLIVAIYSAEG